MMAGPALSYSSAGNLLAGCLPSCRAAGTNISIPAAGGNMTGITILAVQLVPKRLELLSELIPRAQKFALLVNPKNGYSEPMILDVQEAAHAKGIQLKILSASTPGEIDDAFASIANMRFDGLIIGDDPFFVSRREQLVALTSRYAVPAIYQFSQFAAAGGLISYGPSLADAVRQAGIYAGKILKGAKPAELPVQQPTTFELLITVKTARGLGITVPPSLLARADEVIE
jgi:putative ABC transport system substrate-binding protein